MVLIVISFLVGSISSASFVNANEGSHSPFDIIFKSISNLEEKNTSLQNQVNTLQSNLDKLDSKVKVLYGGVPDPVNTNQIILPQETVDYDKYCGIRYNCVQPYSILVHVGDSVTWTNKDANNGHAISHAVNYEQNKCGATDTSIDIILASEQSSSMKFDKAGQNDYCVSGYDTGENVHGTIIVK